MCFFIVILCLVWVQEQVGLVMFEVWLYKGGSHTRFIVWKGPTNLVPEFTLAYIFIYIYVYICVDNGRPSINVIFPLYIFFLNI